MNELRPFPFADLLRRLRAELAAGGPVFGLPRADWHQPDPGLDLSFVHAGRRAANPLGPAAGPHTQLAPNLAQGWLAGARVFELKTLQVLDRLQIPRPCIHVPHYGLNVEWSQELSLRESAREYQKAAWLLDILMRGRVGGALPEGAALDTVLDLSVGYSLEGVRSATLQAALGELRDPQAGWEELAAGLPRDLLAFAGDPPAGPLVDCITLSTFHGCPAGEVEAIAAHLLDRDWSVIVKFNPTLVGLDDTVRLLHGRMGYGHLEPDPAAFAADLVLDDAVALMTRLLGRAQARSLSLGAKFTNTLVLRQDAAIFPVEAGPQMYLSGAPLHPLALAAAARFAAAFPERLPISFSAGIERRNAADALFCGLAPLTLCTDLLRRGGQGRLSKVLAAVQERLAREGAHSLCDWLGAAAEGTPAGWQALRERLAGLAERAAMDPAYGAAAVMKAPKKMRRALERLDCISCDLCLPACPNGALFAWDSPAGAGLGEAHQIGVLADACNACSNCETWCPELGAPWRVKERWHQDLASLAAADPELDGFTLADGELRGRLAGRAIVLGGDTALSAGHFSIEGSRWELRGGAVRELPVDLLPLFERARLVWRGLPCGAANPVRSMLGEDRL